MQVGFSVRNIIRPASQDARRRPPKRRRLAFDRLEERRLLTAGTLNTTSPEAFTVPGTAPAGTASSPIVPVLGSPYSVAMDNNGDTVVVWADTNGQTAYSLNFELYAKIGSGSSSSLTPVAGGPLETTGGTPITNNRGFPVVAMSPTSGEFAVGWNASDNQLSRTNTDYVQLYSYRTDGTVTPMGSEISVGKNNAAYMRQIAMNDQGFDVLYGVPDGIWAGFSDPTVQRYSNSGAQLGSAITVAKLSNQYLSASIAMDATGNFVVGWAASTYHKQAKDYVNTLDWQRYASNGSAYGTITPYVLGTSTSTISGSEGMNLAMDANDDVVTVYRDWGSAVGGGLAAIEVTSGDKLEMPTSVDTAGQIGGGNWASISMQPATGDYALSWVDWVSPDANVMANTFDLSGNALQSPIAVYSANEQLGEHNQAASAAIDSSGDVVVVYGAYGLNSQTNTRYTDGGIFGAFYQDPPAFAPVTASTASSPSGSASPGGSPTSVTDAVFAAYAYPADDELLS